MFDDFFTIRPFIIIASFKKMKIVLFLKDYAQNALQREWGNFPFANWNRICWGLLLQLGQFIKIHFLPHLECFIWERIFEKNFFKKSPIQPPNGVLPICQLPFLNGRYRNGVCRTLWVMTLIQSWVQKHTFLTLQPS